MRYFALITVFVLAACGGGGDSPPSSTASFPVEATIARIFGTSGNYGGTHNDSTGSYSLSLSFAPAAAAQFNAAIPASPTFTAAAVLRRNGQIVSSTSSIYFYQTSPLRVIGSKTPTDTTTITQQTPLPATATVGTVGLFYLGTKSNGASVVGTWSIEADSASTAFLCINTVTEGRFLRETEADCFRIDAAGNHLGFKAVTTTNARSTLNNPVIDTFVFQ